MKQTSTLAAVVVKVKQAVQECFGEPCKRAGQTFVIAHRLTTIQNAEEILVLTDKGIEEKGTRQELLALDGVYAKMEKVHQSLRKSFVQI